MTTDDLERKNAILKAIEERHQSIEAVYQLYRNNPYSADYIHRFRVEMRKMRAILNFLKPILENEFYETINQTYRELGKKLSTIRDIDTLIVETEKVAAQHPDRLENYQLVFGYLQEMRLAQAHENAKQEALTKFDKGMKATKILFENFDLKLEKLGEKELADFLANRYDKKGEHLKKRFKSLDSNDYEAVHKLRKEAKKVRYTAASLKAVLPKKQRKPFKKKAKKVQEELGKITDIHTHIEVMQRYKENVPSDKLKKSLQKLIDYKTSQMEKE